MTWGYMTAGDDPVSGSNRGRKRKGPSLKELVEEERRKRHEVGWEGDYLNGFARTLAAGWSQEAIPGPAGWTLVERGGRRGGAAR